MTRSNDKNKLPHQLRPLEEMGNLQESGAAGLMRQTWLLLIVALAPLLAWAAIADIKEVAHVSGQVLPSGSVHVVQHMEGGVVAEILVHESQKVDKDQVLIRFDPHQAVPEREQGEVRLAGLDARAIRLRAFANDQEPDFSSISARFEHLIEAQRRIHRDQLLALASNRAVVEAQIAQRESELEQARDELDNAKRQQTVTGDMVRIRKELVDQKAISRVIYLETLRAHLTAQGEVERLQKQVVNLQGSLDEVRNRKDKLCADSRREASDELAVVAGEMAQVKETLNRMADRVTRLEVRAPVRGIVQNFKYQTPGAVVPPGDALMQLVPVEDHLNVEARIAPEDVGRMTLGQAVVVKLTSYDFSHFGTLPGHLTSLSPSTLTDEQNQPYFKGIVTLTRDYAGPRPGHFPILPGMLAQVDIALGERSVLASLVKPISRSYHEAFKER